MNNPFKSVTQLMNPQHIEQLEKTGRTSVTYAKSAATVIDRHIDEIREIFRKEGIGIVNDLKEDNTLFLYKLQ